MEDCKPVGTPLTADAKLSPSPDNNPGEERIPFRELVGVLMYAALGTRPDITYAVSVLSQFNSCPTQEGLRRRQLG